MTPASQGPIPRCKTFAVTAGTREYTHMCTRIHIHIYIYKYVYVYTIRPVDLNRPFPRNRTYLTVEVLFRGIGEGWSYANHPSFEESGLLCWRGGTTVRPRYPGGGAAHPSRQERDNRLRAMQWFDEPLHARLTREV